MRYHHPGIKNLFLFCVIGMSSVTMVLWCHLSVNNTTVPSLPKIFKYFTGINEINCRKLIQGNQQEIMQAYAHMQKYTYNILSDEYFLDLSLNCSKLKNFMFLYEFPISKSETKFPLAYIILMYKDVEQTVRLLRAIYRPHNYYCILVDLSAAGTTHLAVRAISSCYKNIFMASKQEDVVYEHVSRLQAELNCMTDLIKRGYKWKYVLNLPSQQYPLKTNAEIVQLLQTLKGTNLIEGIINPNRTLKHRYQRKYVLSKGELISVGTKHPFKHQHISIFKGSALGAFSYNFVKFVLESDIAKDLLEWMTDINSPDEYFWATLNHNAAIPAPGRSVHGNPEDKTHLAVYVTWQQDNVECHGKFVRDICIYGIEDLPVLTKVPHLFANKLYIDYQPLAYDCLEEWYFEKAAPHTNSSKLLK